jgi:exodeoxyribonuclease-3
MRIITLNVNGLRSACAKGFMPWMRRQRPDVVCLQEIKCQEADLTKALLAPRGFHAFFHPAERRGYSGVGIYSKREPDKVILGLGIPEFDAQGRYLECEYGALSVVSVYFPSGSASEQAQERKLRFLAAFMPRLERMRACGREFILCGDWNMAHKEIDIRNWRSNRGRPGFTDEERGWLTRLFEAHGFVDVFRRLDTRADRYTWWSNLGQARAKNVGWRIDYQVATPGIAAAARGCDIYTRRWFSDHAPLTIDYEYGL